MPESHVKVQMGKEPFPSLGGYLQNSVLEAYRTEGLGWLAVAGQKPPSVPACLLAEVALNSLPHEPSQHVHWLHPSQQGKIC